MAPVVLDQHLIGRTGVTVQDNAGYEQLRVGHSGRDGAHSDHQIVSYDQIAYLIGVDGAGPRVVEYVIGDL